MSAVLRSGMTVDDVSVSKPHLQATRDQQGKK